MAEVKIKINADSASLKSVVDRIDEINKSLQETKDLKVIKDLTKEGKELTGVFDSLNSSIEEVNTTIVSTVKTIASLEAQQSSLNEQLANAEIGSEAYKDLQKQVIKTSVELKNLELAREALDNEQFASELKSVAGGLGDMAGGLALVGASSGSIEQIVQTIAKVEGVTKAVTGGIEAYSSGVKVLNALSAKGATLQTILAAASGKQAVATGAQAVATEGATVASNGLNLSLLANPIFLLIAAIGAVVGALLYFASSTRDVEAENDALNETLERQNDVLERNNAKIKKAGENRLALAKAGGQSEEEILKIQLENIDKEEEGRKKSVKSALTAIEKKKKLYFAALEEEDEELAKKISGEIAATRKKYKDLSALNGQYIIDKKILTTEFDTKESDEAKKKADDDILAGQDAYKKRLEDQKKYNEDRLAAARRIKDLELSLLPEGEAKELAIQQETNKRALEDLNAKYGDETKLTKTQLEELNSLRGLLTESGQQDIQKINAKYAKLDADREGKDAALIKKSKDEVSDAIEKASEENYIATLDAQEKEVNAVSEKYTQLINLGKHYGQDVSALVEAQAREEAEIRDKYREIADKKSIESIQKSLTDAANIFNEFAASTGSEFAAAIGNSFNAISESITVLTDKTATDLEKVTAGIGALGSIATGFIQAQNATIQEELEASTAVIDEENEAQQASLQAKYDSGILSKEQFDAESIALEKAVNNKKNKEGEKAFEESKKLQIAQTIISGLQGAIGAFSSLSSIPIVGPVLGAAAAVAIGALTASNVGKIKSTKFKGSSVSGGGGGGSSIGGIGGGGSSSSSSAQPQINLFGQGNDANTVGPGAQGQAGQPTSINATVSVTEINATQNKVAVIEERSTL